MDDVSMKDAYEIDHIVEYLLQCLREGESPFVNPEFVKCFNKRVPSAYIKNGFEIAKKYFYQSLPKIVNTNYAGFWFYSVDVLFKLYVKTHNEKIKEFLYKLNKLMCLIFFNSLIYKYVPYKFNYEVWQLAASKTRSKLIKQDLDVVAELFSKSVTDKLLSGHYHRLLGPKVKDKELLDVAVYIRIYYEMRHRLNQLVKPVVVMYYRLIQLQQTGYIGSSSQRETFQTSEVREAANIQNFLLWFSSFYNEKFAEIRAFVLGYLKKRHMLRGESRVSTSFSCEQELVDAVLKGLAHVKSDELEYVIKMLYRGVTDAEFWLNDTLMKEMFEKYFSRVEVNENNVMCVLSVLWAVYLYFTSSGKSQLLESIFNAVAKLCFKRLLIE